MKHINKLARLLLVLGAALLAIYVVATVHRIVLSRAAVRRFEVLKPAALASVSDRTLPRRGTSQPDLVLWSRNRIEGYQDSLGQHLAPTLAVLRIPRIKLEAPMLEGTADLTLNRGVGRIEGTSHLGENGNIGIAGHRDGFFRGLKDINLGDKLELEGPERTYIYIVDKLQVVDPHDVRVLRATSTPSLTLVTCYPFYFIGSAPQRYIVHASAITDF